MECARVLWVKRAQHRTGDLSTQRAKISRNPHIKTSRGLIRFSSRDTHNSQRIQSRYIIISYTVCAQESSRDTRILIYQHMHIQLTSALDSCIMCVYTSRYIMHKCVYTVTLDIECWDDLNVEKIDWAKSINLFPDEFIHSSVQERTSPRPVDRA